MNLALNDDLLDSSLLGSDYTKPITRLQFCSVAVRLAEALTGKSITPASANTFTDTNNAYVLKAYAAGITTGTSATTFSPNATLNRQQMAVFLRSTLRYVEKNSDYSYTSYTSQLSKFKDSSQIAGWAKERDELKTGKHLDHQRTKEYASYIMESIVNNTPYEIGGNVLNKGGLIENLPQDACVEVPCLVNGKGVHPCRVGRLPVQCAAMNMTNINVQLLTIEAAVTRKKEHIYQAAMLDPHTGSELDMDTIVRMVDDLIDAHGSWLPQYK